MGLSQEGLQKAMKLNVAGSSLPSVEDAIGLFLVTFLLLGCLQMLSQRVFGEKKETAEPSAQGPPPPEDPPAAASPPEQGQGAGKRKPSGAGSSSPDPTPK